MENSNMRGHWVGIFTQDAGNTSIEFTEAVTAKKFFLRPFVASYLRKQQARFVADLTLHGPQGSAACALGKAVLKWLRLS